MHKVKTVANMFGVHTQKGSGVEYAIPFKNTNPDIGWHIEKKYMGSFHRQFYPSDSL